MRRTSRWSATSATSRAPATPGTARLGLLTFDLIAGAAAVAVIVLVQGAGVAESAPNAGGRRADAGGNFVAQGVANVAAGLFREVGGSVG